MHTIVLENNWDFVIMAVIQGDYLIQVTVNTGSNVYTGCWISCKNEMGIITTVEVRLNVSLNILQLCNGWN